MDIKKARKILGKKYSNCRDEEIQDIINTLSVLAHLTIEQAVAKAKK